jgi:hypothetical protein
MMKDRVSVATSAFQSSIIDPPRLIDRIRAPLAALAFFVFFTPASSFAACTSPAGNAGAMDYVTANSTFKFCNNTNWVDMGAWLPNSTSIYYNGGKVGIGTDTPGADLQVGAGTLAGSAAGDFGVLGSGGAYIAAKETVSGAETFINAQGSLGVMGTLSSHPLVLRTANADRMRIESTGELSFSGTGAVKLPNGTTAQQPTCNAGAAGSIRFNSQTASIEACNGTSWASVGGGGGGKAPDRQVFTVSGTWTKPSGYGANAVAHVRCWGGGACGGGYVSGSGGHCVETQIALSSLNATQAVTIGAGGTCGILPADGVGAGGATTFATVTAAGGAGAHLANPGTGSSGGTLFAGEKGPPAPWDGFTYFPVVGAQGGCGGGTGGVQNGTPGSGAMNGTTFQAAAVPGGGGGNGGYDGSAYRQGGVGAAGMCIVTVYDGS